MTLDGHHDWARPIPMGPPFDAHTPESWHAYVSGLREDTRPRGAKPPKVKVARPPKLVVRVAKRPSKRCPTGVLHLVLSARECFIGFRAPKALPPGETAWAAHSLGTTPAIVGVTLVAKGYVEPVVTPPDGPRPPRPQLKK